MGGTPLQISSESTDGYFSNTAYQAYGNILYCFTVIGTPDAQLQVESTLEQVVNAFFIMIGKECAENGCCSILRTFFTPAALADA